MTIIINFVGAPSSGKTTLCSLLFGCLKLSGMSVEYVPEYAKQLVWTEQFELLNNQHYVSKKQYDLFKSMLGKVDIVVTDGSLAHGLYYNRYNQDNTSNVEKTEMQILKWMREFDNMFFFVERQGFDYEQVGRVQTEKEAEHVNSTLQTILKKHQFEYKNCVSSLDDLEDIKEIVCASVEHVKKKRV